MLLDYFGLWNRLLAGEGSSASKAKRKRQIYVEQDGKIHIFKTAHEAANWLNSQKQPDRPRAKAARPAKAVPVKTIDRGAIEPIAQQQGFAVQFKEIYSSGDMLELWALAQRILMLQDEDDIAVLLLNA